MSAPSSSTATSSNCWVKKVLLGVGAVGVGAAAYKLCKSVFGGKKHSGCACCSHSFDASDARLNYTFDEQYESLKAVYPELRDSFLTHLKKTYDCPDFAIQRLERMFDYTILGGKYNRATLVLNTVQILCKHNKLNIGDRWKSALVLGWCIEILQACFLVADDIMDGSITRRGQPCWYKLADVQLDAVNDTLILESFLYYLINTYLGELWEHVQIFKLYQECSFQTQMGQMLDLLGQPQGRKDPELLKNFTIETYNRIVCYKTAIYTFYLPVASGMILCGYNSDQQLSVARQLSIDIGTKFQIEDDYLDCFGEPEKIGKIGTDIKDHKCCWLVVQALTRVTAEQRKILETCYGQDDAAKEAKVKQLYKDIDLPKIYDQYEDESYARIISVLEKNAAILPSEIFLPVLKKIHKREK